MLNRRDFFDSIRPHVGLTTQNVAGMEKVLDYGIERGTQVNKFAYILATAWWETAQTMWPVREAYWLSEGWRRRNLRSYPWYGRGLIQTTWKDNYARMGREIGVDLTEDPNLLLQWEYALPALFVGMEKGLYTGKDLDDYIDDKDEKHSEDYREYVNARRIVNGTDKAATIARLSLDFEKALKAGGYTASEPIDSKSVLKLYQEKLASLGYPPGPIDGIWGPKTSKAVRAFQVDQKGLLKVDGILGPLTSAALDQATLKVA